MYICECVSVCVGVYTKQGGKERDRFTGRNWLMWLWEPASLHGWLETQGRIVDASAWSVKGIWSQVPSSEVPSWNLSVFNLSAFN